jgi:hypothetical protein
LASADWFALGGKIFKNREKAAKAAEFADLPPHIKKIRAAVSRPSELPPRKVLNRRDLENRGEARPGTCL